jgi:hypothetical protein
LVKLMTRRRKLRLRKARRLVLEWLLLSKGLRVLEMLVRLGLRRRKLLVLLVVNRSVGQSIVRYLALGASNAGTTAAAKLEEVQQAGSAISITTTTIGTVAAAVGRHGRIHRRCRGWGRKIHERGKEARLFQLCHRRRCNDDPLTRQKCGCEWLDVGPKIKKAVEAMQRKMLQSKQRLLPSLRHATLFT